MDQKTANEIFEYREGKLFWKMDVSNKARKGSECGSLMHNGYCEIKYNRKRYYRHRIIFLMHNGPTKLCIDHINGNVSDDRIENLRSCEHIQNIYNSKIRTDNTSGFKGVSWSNQKKAWRVRVWANRKEILIGFFEDLDEAGKAAESARERLHGEFARHE